MHCEVAAIIVETGTKTYTEWQIHSQTTLDTHYVDQGWDCWLGHQTCKNIISEVTYTVLTGTLSLT